MGFRWLTLLLPLAAVSCMNERPLDEFRQERKVELRFTADGLGTRSDDPDEDLVTDMNIFVFNGYGLLEDKAYFPSGQLPDTGGGTYAYETPLLADCTYSIYACANTGFELSYTSLEDLLSYRYYLAYPDDYRIGVPMSGVKAEFVYNGEPSISVPLRRAMAKVSISMDRGGLDSDVDLTITGVTVGNCPKSVLLFSDSTVSGTDDTYNVGFNKTGTGVDMLNRNVSGSLSGEVSLYMFENLQGTPLGDIQSYSEKVFESTDPRREQCSYIELKASYYSGSYSTLPGESLIYRFYIGESVSDFNVRRNSHYHISLRPEGTGLEGGDWMVDKTGLEYSGQTSISVSPSTYIRGKVGEVFDIRCITVPSDAPLEIDMELLEDDKERGIYDYAIDEDGRGVTITLTKSGAGMLYFEAGDPVNDAELVFVEVDLE